MANVEKWADLSLTIQWRKTLWGDVIHVKNAILNSDVHWKHCMKMIKSGKVVFRASRNIIFEAYSKSGWGDYFGKPTFCSPNHARIFAKNNNGL